MDSSFPFSLAVWRRGATSSSFCWNSYEDKVMKRFLFRELNYHSETAHDWQLKYQFRVNWYCSAREVPAKNGFGGNCSSSAFCSRRKQLSANLGQGKPFHEPFNCLRRKWVFSHCKSAPLPSRAVQSVDKAMFRINRLFTG